MEWNSQKNPPFTSKEASMLMALTIESEIKLRTTQRTIELLILGISLSQTNVENVMKRVTRLMWNTVGHASIPP